MQGHRWQVQLLHPWKGQRRLRTVAREGEEMKRMRMREVGMGLRMKFHCGFVGKGSRLLVMTILRDTYSRC